MKAIFLFSFLILFTKCNHSKTQNVDGEIFSDSLLNASANFKNDSLGCNQLRTKKSITFIYERSGMKGKELHYLLKLLGQQNDSSAANGLLTLRYYFGRHCSNGLPIDSVDRCWADFYVDLTSRRVEDLNFICE